MSKAWKLVREKLMAAPANVWATTIFCKALYFFMACKLVLAAPIIIKILQHRQVTIPDNIGIITLLLPSMFAVEYPHFFLAICAVFVFGSLLVRLNYFCAIFNLWIAINFYVIIQSAANGSDLLLILLIAFAVFLSGHYREHSQYFSEIWKISLHNTALLLCRLQLGFIYLLSGWDKLHSPLWRSGEALFAVNHIDYMVNPHFSIDLNHETWRILSWCVILYELLFPLLIWIPGIRIAIIVLGVFFHMVIWIWLSLPDFGILMIISLLIFLNDNDYKSVRLLRR
jgi:uncharacterized membrane protein YphA (DoxX/SURF4 family)